LKILKAAQLLGHRPAAFPCRSNLGHAHVLAAALLEHRTALRFEADRAVAWIPFLAADLGCLFGPAVTATLQKYRRLSLINARRSTFTLGALMMIGVAFAGFVQNHTQRLPLSASLVRAPDTVGNGDHDVIRSVQKEARLPPLREWRHLR